MQIKTVKLEADKNYKNYCESFGRMTIFCPEWRFGRFLAANWSWPSAAKMVERITGIMVDWQVFFDEFDGDKQVCAHALWEKHKAEYMKIWESVHSAD